MPVKVKDEVNDTTMKAEEQRSERGLNSRRSSSIQSAKNNSKISSFFSIVKKQAIAVGTHTSTDYFQPFFAKPNQTVVEYNLFTAPKSATINVPPNWESRQVVPHSRKKYRCSCVGFDSKPTLLVMKLLQFHTNYRPPYFGTWRSANHLAIKARQPFAKRLELEYDYDSDDDWGEDEEILDAESITGSEDDDDEEDVEGMSDVTNDDDSESSVSRIV